VIAATQDTLETEPLLATVLPVLAPILALLEDQVEIIAAPLEPVLALNAVIPVPIAPFAEEAVEVGYQPLHFHSYDMPSL
jgi:hypothetical protein